MNKVTLPISFQVAPIWLKLPGAILSSFPGHAYLQNDLASIKYTSCHMSTWEMLKGDFSTVDLVSELNWNYIHLD